MLAAIHFVSRKDQTMRTYCTIAKRRAMQVEVEIEEAENSKRADILELLKSQVSTHKSESSEILPVIDVQYASSYGRSASPHSVYCEHVAQFRE